MGLFIALMVMRICAIATTVLLTAKMNTAKKIKNIMRITVIVMEMLSIALKLMRICAIATTVLFTAKMNTITIMIVVMQKQLVLRDHLLYNLFLRLGLSHMVVSVHELL